MPTIFNVYTRTYINCLKLGQCFEITYQHKKKKYYIIEIHISISTNQVISSRSLARHAFLIN